MTTRLIFYPQGQPAFFCPACRVYHEFSVDVANSLGGMWTWNEDHDSPTIDQTVITKIGDQASGQVWICEAWVHDGLVSFMEATTHLAAGQTLPLQPGE